MRVASSLRYWLLCDTRGCVAEGPPGFSQSAAVNAALRSGWSARTEAPLHPRARHGKHRPAGYVQYVCPQCTAARTSTAADAGCP